MTTCCRRRVEWRWTATARFVLFAVLFVVSVTHAEGYRPASPDTILVRLDARSRRPAGSPIDAARAAMTLGRATLDDRHFGRAETLLRAALSCLYRTEAGLQFDRCARAADPEALLAYADLLQHGHDFATAERALDALLARDGANARARLMRASIHMARGDPQQALSDCKRLILTGGSFVASACISQAIGLNGKLDEAIGLIEALDDAPVRGESRAWALSILAELYERRGQPAAAIAAMERALVADSKNIALCLQAVDLLLRHSRAQRAQALLDLLPDAAAVILRRALAARALQLPSAGELRDRWFALAAAEERLGIATHGRDRAVGELRLMTRPAIALRFALANWQHSRDIEDARIVIAAATANGTIDAASAVDKWLDALRVEDAVIESIRDGSRP